MSTALKPRLLRTRPAVRKSNFARAMRVATRCVRSEKHIVARLSEWKSSAVCEKSTRRYLFYVTKENDAIMREEYNRAEAMFFSNILEGSM